MTTTRWVAAVLVGLTAAASQAQPPAPKPGPEHDYLKKLEGTWEFVMSSGGADMKGTTVYKMELGGLWLVGSMECDFPGQKFTGKSLDTYDAAKKKYVGVWADSMGTQPMLMEGDLDPATKTLTMIGDGPGPDGKPAKWKGVSVMPDADTIDYKMYVGDAKEPMFTVKYKRKK